MNPTPKSNCSFSYITLIYGLYYFCIYVILYCLESPSASSQFIHSYYFCLNFTYPQNYVVFSAVCLKASITTTQVKLIHTIYIYIPLPMLSLTFQQCNHKMVSLTLQYVFPILHSRAPSLSHS